LEDQGIGGRMGSEWIFHYVMKKQTNSSYMLQCCLDLACLYIVRGVCTNVDHWLKMSNIQIFTKL
jgi:hypothetical protein